MFVSVENIKTLESDKYISEDDFKNEFKIFPEFGDILLTRIGDVGSANIILDNIKRAYYVSLALLKPKGVNSLFLLALLSSASVQSEIWKRTLHIAFPKKINKNEISKVIVSKPSILEQKKIGELIYALDQIITLHQRKLDNLKLKKKALLQKLFPKNGEYYPELRFPGFTDAWEQCKLSDITEVIMGQSPSSKNYTDNPNDDILVQGNADLKDGKVVPRLWTKEITKTIDKGGIILTVRAPVGDVAKTDYKVVLGRGVAGIKGNDYIYQFLQKLQYNRYWVSLSSGSTFESINSNDIKDLIIDIPSIEEQTKISMLLNNVNSIITLHQRKLDKLQATKKALLQEMFPEEGQDKPKRRFKGFTDAWEQRKLGDFTNQINTFVNPEDAKLPLWSLTAEAGLIEKSDRYERDFLVKKKDQFKRIETNTLVYNPMNITIGSIDIYTGLYPIAVSGYYVSIVYDKNIDTDFLKEVLLLPSSLKMYKNYATGSLIERQRVQYPTFSKLQLLLPNLDEQKAIGQFFKSLNLDITLHQRKLDKLKNLKQAYLNEMFV